MKLSRNWLRQYVRLYSSAEELQRAITFLGFEVESVHQTGLPPLQHVVVGEIKTRDKHPNADKLSVCTVDVGSVHGGVRTIVCGAHNCDAGNRVPVALPGAVLPGDFKIKQSKIFFRRTITERRVHPWLRDGPASGRNRLSVLIVDIGHTFADEHLRPLVQLLELVRRVTDLTIPRKAQPLEILLDPVHELSVFGDRIGVIETKVAGATELGSKAEVQTDRFCMADVQVPVRLRRETGSHDPTVSTRRYVALHLVTDEVGRAMGRRIFKGSNHLGVLACRTSRAKGYLTLLAT